jgi:hypothetical protein
MMTKWDSIQDYIRPIEPKYWGDENELEDNELSLDELLELEENEINEMEME